MSKSADDKPEPSEAAPSSTAESEEGGSTLSLRSLDEIAAPPPRAADPQGAMSRTLSSIDWLDTIVDEQLLALDRSASKWAPEPQQTAHAGFEPTDFVTPPSSIDRAAVLDKVVLGYSPIIDRQQGVIATRLTVVPTRADAAVDAGALLDAIGQVWPASGGTVSLNVSSASLVADLLRARPSPNVMIEVPAFVAAKPANAGALQELAARGSTLLIKGRPDSELPRSVLSCFKWSIVDFADDRRLAAPSEEADTARVIPHIQAGVRTLAQLRLSFDRGAIAVVGWPMHEPIAAHFEAHPDLRVVLEMIGKIDQHDPSAAVQRPLLRDPVLAYELLCHVNEVTGPLQMETGSFQQAIALLGGQHLRRWLATLLERTGDEVNLRPVNFAALRRGLLMRMLAPAGSDAPARSELFMCGVFSLLDRSFGRPIGELLGRLAIPERVGQALLGQGGPFRPLLDLARAIESEVPNDIRAAANAAFIAPAEINRALLRTLLVASELERGSPP